LTVTVHVAPAAIVLPLKVSAVSPATGAKIGEPQPLVVADGGLSTTIAPGAVGNVSLNATLVWAVKVSWLVIVKVRIDVPPARMVLGLKAFVMVNGRVTNTVSEPLLLFSLSSMIILLGSTEAVFLRLPVDAGVTLKETVKMPPIAMVTVPMAVGLQLSVPLLIAQVRVVLPPMPLTFASVGVP